MSAPATANSNNNNNNNSNNHDEEVSRKAMKKLVRSSMGYCIFGLLGGVYWRELTRRREVNLDLTRSQLRVFHTHCFAVGSFFLLTVLVLEKNFRLSRFPHYKKFNAFYGAGIGITLLMMLVHGTLTVIGKDEPNRLISWTAGLGHVLTTVGFGFFFSALNSAVAAS